jgi:putative molybdopterin biosynthesis protein
LSARSLALGSLGGLASLRRGECDLAPIHLLDPQTGHYNRTFLIDGMDLIPGWRRMQGIVHRRDDARFANLDDPRQAAAAALADPDCLMVNRNHGACTRVLIDQLLGGRQPPGYWNQPRSHNAVAAAVAQGRADWGVAIRPVADANGLGFIALAEEHYDFAVAEKPRAPEAIAAFRRAISEAGAALDAIGFTPADRT